MQFTVSRNITARCNDCGFSSTDLMLVQNHSCDVVEFGGQCEDFPCCGHERGDCNGLKYGSDEAIKARVWEQMDRDDADPWYGDRQAEYDDQWS